MTENGKIMTKTKIARTPLAKEKKPRKCLNKFPASIMSSKKALMNAYQQANWYKPDVKQDNKKSLVSRQKIIHPEDTQQQGNQRFPVRVWLLPKCRNELSVVIAWLTPPSVL